MLKRPGSLAASRNGKTVTISATKKVQKPTPANPSLAVQIAFSGAELIAGRKKPRATARKVIATETNNTM